MLSKMEAPLKILSKIHINIYFRHISWSPLGTELESFFYRLMSIIRRVLEKLQTCIIYLCFHKSKFSNEFIQSTSDIEFTHVKSTVMIAVLQKGYFMVIS